MKLAILPAVLSLLLPAGAQSTCGTGVTATVTPAVAAPGTPIQVTVQNGSNGTITFFSQCVFNVVYPGTICSGSPFAGPFFCGPGVLTIAPGSSATMTWNQVDNNGAPAPPGDYSFTISHSAGTCCVTVTIGPPATSYCSAKVNSQGCTPQLDFTGTPSTSNALRSFQLTASNLISNKPAVLNYGHGRDNLPFLGGVLCVQAPQPLAVLFTGGNPPPDDCSGTASFDLNPYLQSGTDPLLVAGATLHAQFWQRDPAHPDGSGAGHTAGLEITIQD